MTVREKLSAKSPFLIILNIVIVVRKAV